MVPKTFMCRPYGARLIFLKLTQGFRPGLIYSAPPGLEPETRLPLIVRKVRTQIYVASTSVKIPPIVQLSQ